MTRIKLCGLTRLCEIETANEIKPDYIGFVFAEKSKRYIMPEDAAKLKESLNSEVKAVGVFVNASPEMVAQLLGDGIIDIAQLHGNEDEAYIERLRNLTDRPLIKAFQIDEADDMIKAQNSSADYVLLDSGSGGTGAVFDWNLTEYITRPYFLAGGLNVDNVKEAVESLVPYAVDVSSGIETDGHKDIEKMKRFVNSIKNIK